jgi:hypothetical protein
MGCGERWEGDLKYELKQLKKLDHKTAINTIIAPPPPSTPSIEFVNNCTVMNSKVSITFLS